MSINLYERNSNYFIPRTPYELIRNNDCALRMFEAALRGLPMTKLLIRDLKTCSMAAVARYITHNIDGDRILKQFYKNPKYTSANQRLGYLYNYVLNRRQKRLFGFAVYLQLNLIGADMGLQLKNFKGKFR